MPDLPLPSLLPGVCHSMHTFTQKLVHASHTNTGTQKAHTPHTNQQTNTCTHTGTQTHTKTKPGDTPSLPEYR